MAQLKQTSITGSLNISGSTIIMPNLTASVYSGSGGQMWIDDSAGLEMKFIRNMSYGDGSWAIGGNLINQNHANFAAGIGRQNAALAAGGNGAPNTQTDKTEHYNGTAWSAGGTLNNSRYKFNGSGVETSAFVAGGEAPGVVADTEVYNGTAWSTSGNLIQCRYGVMTAGASANVGLAFGGCRPGAWVSCTEEFNGSTWSSANAMNQARSFGFGEGVQNSALAAGGYCGSPAAGTVQCNSESYNGTSWSAGGNMNFGRTSGGAAGTCSDAFMAMGGTTHPGELTCTEFYDGSTWTVGSAFTIARRRNVGAGTTCAGLVFAGISPGNVSSTSTQEWTRPEVIPFTCTLPGVWSSGGSLITARRGLGGGGTQNAGIVYGGTNGPGNAPQTQLTEEYDGSSWSAGGTLITGYWRTTGGGTQNAAIQFGGYCSGGSTNSSNTEEYNGSAWSSGGALINARAESTGTGTQNAALATSGKDGPISCVEEYNGSAWANGGAIITARRFLASSGTQNAGLAFGGVTVACTEEYNGSSWSTGGALSTGRWGLSGAGSQTDSLAFGGNNGSYRTCTEEYDGTSWSSSTALITALALGSNGGGGQQTTSAAFVAGGYNPSNLNNTQEFNKTEICTGTYQCYLPGVWSNSGNLITARIKLSGNSSSIGAGIVMGGCAPIPINVMYACTEEYNGSSWSAGGAMINARGLLGGFGTQDAQVAAGGSTTMPTNTSDLTEEYNGSSWSTATAMITAMREIGRAGTTAHAGLVFTGGSNKTQEYDGTNWSTGGNLITGTVNPGGFGEANAAVRVGGEAGALQTCVEHYDGSTWSAATAYPLITCAAQGAGTQNAGVSFGGATFPSPSTEALQNTYSYNGVSWSASGNLNCGRSSTGGNGTQSGAFAAGGVGPATLNLTENYCEALVYYNLDANFHSI